MQPNMYDWLLVISQEMIAGRSGLYEEHRYYSKAETTKDSWHDYC